MTTMAPLRHRGFRYLLAGRAANALGNAFAPIALAFAVLDLTGSATDLGFVVGARTVVNVAFLLFGGVLADRMPRSVLMIGSSAAAAITQGAVAALVLTHTATVPLLICLGYYAFRPMRRLPRVVPFGARTEVCGDGLHACPARRR